VLVGRRREAQRDRDLVRGALGLRAVDPVLGDLARDAPAREAVVELALEAPDVRALHRRAPQLERARGGGGPRATG
jgi:hypothetical protein